ncbi:MAG: ABC transporter permease [Clostridiales Family XIII bacterium]|nr:ABC transporter permease [Clostridiales Family XIII bacterium]
MNVKQSLLMALKSMKTSKMRSFLTMLGIVIGVASVIILISIMNGLSDQITSNLKNAGTDNITVNVFGRGGNRSFQYDDMERVVAENPTFFTSFSPNVNASVTVKNGTKSVSTSVRGTNEYYQDIQSVEVEAGRFLEFVDVERLQKVCVIGSYIAEELFDGSVYEDSTVKINGSTYAVVGVLKETAKSEEASADDIVYIPYSTATRLSGNSNIGNWVVKAADVSNIDAAITELRDKLYLVYGDSSSYRVSSMSQLIETLNEITSSISMVLVGIAGISLVVGGIGIMNIMLVSVTERTREIGIRKALGARRRAILSQFIIEAATTSAAGGIIGIILGIVLALVAGSLLDMAVKPSINAVLIAFGVSVAIGMVFGYFPAGKAAKLHPIDALRYE